MPMPTSTYVRTVSANYSSSSCLYDVPVLLFLAKLLLLAVVVVGVVTYVLSLIPGDVICFTATKCMGAGSVHAKVGILEGEKSFTPVQTTDSSSDTAVNVL